MQEFGRFLIYAWINNKLSDIIKKNTRDCICFIIHSNWKNFLHSWRVFPVIQIPLAEVCKLLVIEVLKGGAENLEVFYFLQSCQKDIIIDHIFLTTVLTENMLRHWSTCCLLNRPYVRLLKRSLRCSKISEADEGENFHCPSGKRRHSSFPVFTSNNMWRNRRWGLAPR